MPFAENSPIVSDISVLMAALGGIISAVIIKIESISKVFSDIKLGWLKARSDTDSIVIKQLNDHIERLDKAIEANKEELIDLRSEVAFHAHEQGECMAEEERLWGHLIMSNNYSVRIARVLGEHAIAIDQPPAVPQRRQRITNAEFRERTKATNERLAKESAIILPTMVPPPDKGQI